MKIPTEFLDDFKSRTSAMTPRVAVRAMTDLSGNLGETYLLSSETSMLLYSGKLGGEYEHYELKFRDVTEFTIEIDRPFVFAHIATVTQDLRLKCAVFDLDRLNRLCELANQSRSTSAPTGISDNATVSIDGAKPDESPVPFSPMIAFCAMLQALVHLQSTKSAAETKIMELIVHNEKRLHDGYRYWQQTGTDALIAQVNEKCSSMQKQCLMANLLDVAMVDGTLECEEQQFLERVRQEFAIEVAEFNRIFDVLIIKNNHTVF